MPIVAEPTIITQDTDNPAFWLNAQMTDLFSAIRNLNLTSRSGAIQHLDKAGNLNAQYLVLTTDATPDTENVVAHTLGHIPTGYIAVKTDKACSLYGDGTTGTLWSTTSFSFYCDIASVAVTILVF